MDNTENMKDQKASELFDKIQESIFNLHEDDENFDALDATEVTLDVLDQMLARIIASCCKDEANLKELCQQSFDNISEMAEEFYTRENQG